MPMQNFVSGLKNNQKGEEKMMNVNSGDNSGMLIVILVIVLAAAAMGIATLLRIRKNI